MKKQTLFLRIFSVGWFLLFLSGCSAPAQAPTPPPPTAAPTITPASTATSAPTPEPTGVPTVTGEEFVLQFQTLQGEHVADGGVISETGSSVQMGGNNKNAGYWKPVNGKTYLANFFDPSNKLLLLKVYFQGDVRWDKNGNIFTGLDSFAQAELASQPGAQQAIVKRTGKEGGVVIVLADGSAYYLYSFAYNFAGYAKAQ
jgi:hypothetical protein